MNISIIAAMGHEREIGMQGRIPWRLPDDLKRFKELTSGHVVIMGHSTYESIGHPLSNRTNVIVTRNEEYFAPGCQVAHSIEEALDIAKDDPEAFVIGGAEIYRQILPRTDRMYLTIVDRNFPNADRFFPVFNVSEWEIMPEKIISVPTSDKNPLGSVFVVYERK